METSHPIPPAARRKPEDQLLSLSNQVLHPLALLISFQRCSAWCIRVAGEVRFSGVDLWLLMQLGGCLACFGAFAPKEEGRGLSAVLPGGGQWVEEEVPMIGDT